MSVLDYLKTLLPQQWRQAAREHLVARSVRPILGPMTVELGNNEAVVTCVVKNGGFYIEQFIEHYFRLGFRHIFFLDNGSADETIQIARRHANVSICSSSLPIHIYQPLFKRHLARTSASGGWCLDADIDEFFDYPMSEHLSLAQLLAYLNRSSYTAMLTQLLDMFSDKPFNSLGSDRRPLELVYAYYDLSNIRPVEYTKSELVRTYAHANRVSTPETTLYYGGIRKTLYGNDCLLTKHSLFRVDENLELFPHVHFVNRANLADVSGVMRHYKLTGNALDIALQNRQGFVANSRAYSDFIDFLTAQSCSHIKPSTAQRDCGLRKLVEDGLIFASSEYGAYVEEIRSAERATLVSGKTIHYPSGG